MKLAHKRRKGCEVIRSHLIPQIKPHLWQDLPLALLFEPIDVLLHKFELITCSPATKRFLRDTGSFMVEKKKSNKRRFICGIFSFYSRVRTSSAVSCIRKTIATDVLPLPVYKGTGYKEIWITNVVWCDICLLDFSLLPSCMTHLFLFPLLNFTQVAK